MKSYFIFVAQLIFQVEKLKPDNLICNIWLKRHVYEVQLCIEKFETTILIPAHLKVNNLPHTKSYY